jgi:hypothetical protein
MKKREVFNTKKMAEDNLLILLAEAMAGGTGRMIENQEAHRYIVIHWNDLRRGTIGSCMAYIRILG